jgi:hypothetical protein
MTQATVTQMWWMNGDLHWLIFFLVVFHCLHSCESIARTLVLYLVSLV